MSDFNASEGTKTGALPTETVLGGRYLVKHRLGQGGMGAVYLAYDQRLDIECAIKEMSTALLKTEDERDRARRAFHEEAKLLARLGHANLPRVTDHFSENGKEYLVMEYVPGETLAQVMRRQPPPWPVEEVMALAEPLTEVLHYLHTRTPPIIFRDLKPANVMRTPEGQIKLIDFGIARLFKPGQSHDTQAFGTMGYSAPEQYGQGQTDARSDVYSLGMLLHQLASAHDPISQPFNVPLAHRLNARVPEQWSAVVQTAMHHDPDNRFASMVAFRRALVNGAGVSQPYVAARPMSPAVQPQVGYTAPGYPLVGGYAQPNRPTSQPYNQPTPQQPYGPPTPQQPHNQPTPQQSYGPPTPQQPYNQPTPQQPLGGYPSQAYAPQPVAYGGPQAYAGPPTHYGAQPTAVTTGLASLARWMGVGSMAIMLLSFLTPVFGAGGAGAVAILGLFVSGVTFIISLIAVNHRETRGSIKGRAHAGLGLGLSIAAILLFCATIANVATYMH